jgi:hypothetical protein
VRPSRRVRRPGPPARVCTQVQALLLGSRPAANADRTWDQRQIRSETRPRGHGKDDPFSPCRNFPWWKEHYLSGSTACCTTFHPAGASTIARTRLPFSASKRSP